MAIATPKFAGLYSTTCINQIHTTIFQRGAAEKASVGFWRSGTPLMPSSVFFQHAEGMMQVPRKKQLQAPSNHNSERDMHTTTGGDVQISSAYPYFVEKADTKMYQEMFLNPQKTIQILYLCCVIYLLPHMFSIHYWRLNTLNYTNTAQLSDSFRTAETPSTHLAITVQD